MSTELPPSTLPEREEQIRRLVRAYEQQLRQSLPTEPQTLEQIERRAEEIGEAVKQRIQKEVTDAQGTGYDGRILACGCGKLARYVADYTRNVVTLHGPLRVERAYYYCRACQQGFCPLDRVLQLGSGQCSVLVQALVCRFAAFLSFDTTARELRLICGVNLSVSTVRRLALATGAQVQQQWTQPQTAQTPSEPAEAAPRPKQLHVTCDGVMLHVNGAWREAKIGAVYPKAQAGGVTQAAYYATLSKSAVFGTRLHKLAQQHGAENCREVAVVADGAEWIWQEAGKYFAARVQILDYYHACEHLWQFAHARYGEGSEAAKTWMARQQTRLRANQVGWVLRDLTTWPPKTQAQQEVQRKVSQYLRTHLRRMRYQTFEQAGYHIGSGVAEAACKNVIQARFKQAGMRWKEPSAEAMLHLRAAWCSTQQADFVQVARAANRHV